MSGNQIHKKHALGNRANKISQGILTVRFEMPFPIWCTHCPKPTIIGQGVRFNAEKKKVGNYYSSPIYSFRMKHIACGGVIEIRTDPQNTAYVVTEGARKRDLGDDKVEEGDIKILTSEEREKLRANAFAALEGKVEDKQRLEHAKLRIEELQELSSQQWDDPYAMNRKLRSDFRVGRHSREKEARVTGALQDRMSLGIDLLPDHEDDIRKAKLIDFGGLEQEKLLAKAISKPLFSTEEGPSKQTNLKSSKKSTKRQNAEALARKQSANVIAEIRGNTRAAMDPFLHNATKPASKSLWTGVKRKRSEEQEAPAKPSGSILVDYDSD